jgi:hypothetical protein
VGSRRGPPPKAATRGGGAAGRGAHNAPVNGSEVCEREWLAESEGRDGMDCDEEVVSGEASGGAAAEPVAA